jgi:hypothetical protein
VLVCTGATEDAASRRVLAGQSPVMVVRWRTYPCLCLWRGLVQMTMVRPCRLITRQRSHMGFTDGRTFKRKLLLDGAICSAEKGRGADATRRLS